MIVLLSMFYQDRSRDFWEPIGKYVFTFGLFEREVDKCVCDLLDVPYFTDGQMAMFQMGLSARINLLTALAGKYTAKEEIKARLKTLADDLERQNTFRNHLVHGAWTAFETNNHNLRRWQKFGLSRRLKPHAFNVSVADISSNLDELERAGREMSAIVHEVWEERQSVPAPSLDKPPGPPQLP
jgi:hypothetical protein